MIKFILSEIRNCHSLSWLLDGNILINNTIVTPEFSVFLIIGFPRTLPQAEKLWAAERLDVVLNLNVPFDVIIDRVKGRWVHLPSGRVYNTDFNAPKVPVRTVLFIFFLNTIIICPIYKYIQSKLSKYVEFITQDVDLLI